MPQSVQYIKHARFRYVWFCIVVNDSTLNERCRVAVIGRNRSIMIVNKCVSCDSWVLVAGAIFSTPGELMNAVWDANDSFTRSLGLYGHVHYTHDQTKAVSMSGLALTMHKAMSLLHKKALPKI